MVKILSVILLVLLLIVGRLKGLKNFICFYLNYFLILGYIFLMGCGINAILLSLLTCVVSAASTLFIVNGYNVKTRSAFRSVLIILAVMFVLVLIIGRLANIQGFSKENAETIGIYSMDIGYSMADVLVGMVILCTIGTVIDTSLSVSTALNEVHVNNPHLDRSELFRSGMNVGRDILSTTINTLLFAFMGGLVAFFLWHQADDPEMIINGKALVQGVFELFSCLIASVLVIPVTSLITSKRLLSEDNDEDTGNDAPALPEAPADDGAAPAERAASWQDYPDDE
ncbi:MAG: YibE/F family protein [Lachnospiraceae bacterium]|nr:YibE/F family protein [Lachnospiraceae bacterium]